MRKIIYGEGIIQEFIYGFKPEAILFAKLFLKGKCGTVDRQVVKCFLESISERITPSPSLKY
ncbi:MAG TPA: hypothetical protein ENL41_00445 [candidate division WOR-3 bacterium]|uniref:Uncharacterized protein n=1 Tax=candidate division WOR-3 bacterium TaxID=2052148 RepID=A0A7C5I119_UNCW3|nr:hypothetical protein [candidate division WOR-3 bacterium]